MKRSEVREILERFWAMEEGEARESYYRAMILPHLIEAVMTLETKFIRHVVAVMEAKTKEPLPKKNESSTG